MTTKIYTRTGDDGSTAVFGAGRVQKAHPRVQAYGAVDELNAVLGICNSHTDRTALQTFRKILTGIQHDLFTLGADLGTPLNARVRVPRITADNTVDLELHINTLEEDLSPLANFILPGGGVLASYLHLARTVCRRAERAVVAARKTIDLNSHTLEYLNRLSDLLFVMARWANLQEGKPDLLWEGP